MTARCGTFDHQITYAWTPSVLQRTLLEQPTRAKKVATISAIAVLILTAAGLLFGSWVIGSVCSLMPLMLMLDSGAIAIRARELSTNQQLRDSLLAQADLKQAIDDHLYKNLILTPVFRYMMMS